MHQELAIRSKINAILTEGEDEQLNESVLLTIGAGLAAICISAYLLLEGYRRAADKERYRQSLEQKLWAAAKKTQTMMQQFPKGRAMIEPVQRKVAEVISTISGKREITSWKGKDGAPAQAVEQLAEVTDFFWEQFLKWKKNLPQNVMARVENAAQRIETFTFGAAAAT